MLFRSTDVTSNTIEQEFIIINESPVSEDESDTWSSSSEASFSSSVKDLGFQFVEVKKEVPTGRIQETLSLFLQSDPIHMEFFYQCVRLEVAETRHPRTWRLPIPVRGEKKVSKKLQNMKI